MNYEQAINNLANRKDEAVRLALTALKAVKGDCQYCKYGQGPIDNRSPCYRCSNFAAKELVTGDYWEYRYEQNS